MGFITQSNVLEQVQAQTSSRRKGEGAALEQSDVFMLRGRNGMKVSIVVAVSSFSNSFFFIALLGICLPTSPYVLGHLYEIKHKH